MFAIAHVVAGEGAASSAPTEARACGNVRKSTQAPIDDGARRGAACGALASNNISQSPTIHGAEGAASSAPTEGRDNIRPNRLATAFVTRPRIKRELRSLAIMFARKSRDDEPRYQFKFFGLRFGAAAQKLRAALRQARQRFAFEFVAARFDGARD